MSLKFRDEIHFVTFDDLMEEDGNVVYELSCLASNIKKESCEFVFAHGSSMHQKCSNYALTNLLFGLCRSVWIIDPLVIRPSLYPEALACLSTPKVLRTKERTPIIYPFDVFT
jgi:hypothetical protein